MIRLKQLSSEGASSGDLVTFSGANWGASPAGSAQSLSDIFDCPITVAVLDAVYLSAPATVDKADADDVAKYPCVGIVSSKPTPITAVVQFTGPLSGFAGLTSGATYYLSTTPGAVTDVPPSNPPDPSNTVVQEVGWAKDATTLEVVLDRDWIVLA